MSGVFMVTTQDETFLVYSTEICNSSKFKTAHIHVDMCFLLFQSCTPVLYKKWFMNRIFFASSLQEIKSNPWCIKKIQLLLHVLLQELLWPNWVTQLKKTGISTYADIFLYNVYRADKFIIQSVSMFHKLIMLHKARQNLK